MLNSALKHDAGGGAHTVRESGRENGRESCQGLVEAPVVTERATSRATWGAQLAVLVSLVSETEIGAALVGALSVSRHRDQVRHCVRTSAAFLRGH